MLTIPRTAFDQLRRHGEKTYPHECCGVLLGETDGDGVRVVRDTVPCQNTRIDSPQNRYHIDPRELVRIQREARERELDIIGFYHSHPDHPARWSATDLSRSPLDRLLLCDYQRRARPGNRDKLLRADRRGGDQTVPGRGDQSR